MQPGTVIYQGKLKDGRDITIRYPQDGDVQIMTDFINSLSAEKTFITYQGEQISLEDETKYLETLLKKITENQTVNLLAVADGKLAGSTSVTLENRVEKHVGSFAISVAKDFRGAGLGSLLIELILKEAQTHLDGLKIITLGVFGDNPLAISLYSKFGFKEFGRLPEGINHNGQFVDHIEMFKRCD